MISLIKKIDAKQQIAYGEVYAPNQLDSHGEMMSPEEVEKMCHAFMLNGNVKDTVDKNHDNKPVEAQPVESYIAPPDSVDFTPGSWVMGVKIFDGELWEQIEKGELNGYSFEAYVRKVNTVVVVETTPTSVGKTEESEDHTHFFVARIDADGRVVKGRTSTTNGHSHEIKRGTATEMTNGHRHRIFV